MNLSCYDFVILNSMLNRIQAKAFVSFPNFKNTVMPGCGRKNKNILNR
jgi:hypothetical protein